MAFVSAFTPALARSAAFGSRVCTVSPTAARVTMAEKSPSMPFMDAPTDLTPDMPGYVGFGKSLTHAHTHSLRPLCHCPPS